LSHPSLTSNNPDQSQIADLANAEHMTLVFDPGGVNQGKGRMSKAENQSENWCKVVPLNIIILYFITPLQTSVYLLRKTENVLHQRL
jgi:hypothetical protein